MSNKTEGLLRGVLRGLLDPGSPSEDFEAALAVLEQEREWTVKALEERPAQIVSDLAPDRLSRLAKWLPRGTSMPTFVQASLERFRTERERSDGSVGLLPVRKAHALAEVLAQSDSFEKLSDADVAWLFAEDEFAEPIFYEGLAVWCAAHDPIPRAIVELVRDLREQEDDSPILDRLAAWVSPSIQAMVDLAAWENGARRCFEPAWREAVCRWSEGAEPTEADRVLLQETTDPEGSWNAHAFQRAVARHGATALRVADETCRSDESAPVVRVILATWINSLGGAA